MAGGTSSAEQRQKKMADRSSKNQLGSWQDWAILALGAWLFASPWILHFPGPALMSPDIERQPVPAAHGPWLQAFGIASWNAWAVGLLVFLVALGIVIRRRHGQEWVNIVLGVWAFAAPWVLGFSFEPAPAWDHWIVGALIVLAGLLKAGASPSDIRR